MKLLLNLFGFYNIRLPKSGAAAGRKIYFCAIFGFYCFCIHKMFFWSVKNKKPIIFNIQFFLNQAVSVMWMVTPLINLIQFAFCVDHKRFSAEIRELSEELAVSSGHVIRVRNFYFDFVSHVFITVLMLSGFYFTIRWPGSQFSDYFSLSFLETITFLPGIYYLQILFRLLRLHNIISRGLRTKIDLFNLSFTDNSLRSRHGLYFSHWREKIRVFMSQQKRVLTLIFYELGQDFGYSIVLLVSFISMNIVFDFSWINNADVEFQLYAAVKDCFTFGYVIVLFISGQYTTNTVSI